MGTKAENSLSHEDIKLLYSLLYLQSCNSRRGYYKVFVVLNKSFELFNHSHLSINLEILLLGSTSIFSWDYEISVSNSIQKGKGNGKQLINHRSLIRIQVKGLSLLTSVPTEPMLRHYVPFSVKEYQMLIIFHDESLLL